MAKTVFLLILVCLSGCSYDNAFDVFGGGYSEGGTTRTEKRADYDARVDALGEGS